ncbi:MAG: Fis family PAS modulated sigma54 specific transcriptional regulator [Candidatus Magnetoglobus multicellularis str. Araruama]|uniref:Fis family PAS modulated sigma54 specific transcriptional regulator n=1 Tax=Candidatus Magnetoglobus multicellularis str. Araruama TaxID=890399 RepID=A0A1V1P0Z4_9BACT|nr:MAG: Fis family PAS modulated sigma54 specific transcriptional regulator [Candidatus Magnetoglobus multicellularis str. Araruama]
MEHILIIDDEPESLSFLNSILVSNGYTVRSATNVAVALKSAEKYVPDLILLDIHLPDMNGIKGCRIIKQKKNLCDIPIIFLTGRTDVQHKIDAFEAGGVDYITKPFSNQEVLARIKTHLHLQQEKHRYYALAEATSEGIIIHDNGTIIEMNDALEKMMICDRKTFIQRKLSDLFTSKTLKMINESKQSDIQRIEIKEKRLDGYTLVLEIYWRPIVYMDKHLEIFFIRNLTEKRRLERQNESLRSTVSATTRLGDMVGKSDAIQKVFRQIIDIESLDETVLIRGETGTGKELVAMNIHQLSSHKENPFVIVNCAAIPDTLFESSFFGSIKGAFTNAYSTKSGFIEQANGGVLFLDEIGELSPVMQAKLLRVMEDGVYTPVGGKSKHADIRIIAATNKDLETMITTGELREDFYYRLNVIRIHIPPLRSRKEDIPLLIEAFKEKNRSKKAYNKMIPDDVFDQMMKYHWPGNVRQLFNELMLYFATGEMVCFEGGKKSAPHQSDFAFLQQDNLTLKDAVSAFESCYIDRVLTHNEGDKAKTAKQLNVHLRTLYNKMNRNWVGPS